MNATRIPLTAQRGYSLIELMVALAVGSITIAALYAGYAVFEGYSTKLSALAATDRSAVQVLDVLTRDLRVAGYKDFSSSYGPIGPSSGGGVLAVDFSGAIGGIPPGNCGCIAGPGQYCRLTTVYDLSSTQRIGVSYYTGTRTVATRATRCSLWQRRDQWQGGAWSRGPAEVVADWVDNISFVAGDPQGIGRTYAGLPQMVTISLQISAPAITSTKGAAISRAHTTAVRIRNVSLVQ
jgi:prepilin-type N-terminal cleavage/methylation domain-containing protein